MTNIFPQPKKIEFLNKTVIRPQKANVICEDKSLNGLALTVISFLDENGICCIENADYKFILKLSAEITTEEGYELTVGQKETLILAGKAAGLFYGFQTLKQIFIADKISCCFITDEPNNSFRGFMLDVGRYFYSVEDVLRMIDWCATYKLNALHLHLTEDQGWRIQIDKYPKLTEIGSMRSHTNFNCVKHGGFYTKKDIKRIVDYAHKNFMIVIPEFEIPGHSRAAIAAYPELSCFDRVLPVATHWGVKHDILCAGKEFTYKFCYDVIDELIEMFPDGYIHIGGDEAPKTRWKICPHCAKLMKDEGVKNVDELQGYITKKMADYIAAKNYKAIAWFDASCGELNCDNLILQWWGGTTINDQLKSAIENGAKYINSNSSAYYIDLPYGKVSLANTYNLPIKFSNIEDSSAQHGLITTLWTEYVPNMKKAIHMAFPRLIAFAEKCWSFENNLNYDNFLSNLEEHRAFLKKMNIKMTRKGIYNPTNGRGFFQKLWFERRQLAWEGLHNIIDNKKVGRMAKRDSVK